MTEDRLLDPGCEPPDGGFRRWFTHAPEDYVREVLSALPELDPYKIAQTVAWPEFGDFSLADFYASWKQELDKRITGYVYLLEGGGYYKIGRAKDPLARTGTLKIQLPFKTRLVHVIPCEDPVKAERQFHDAYHEERVNGEWFSLDKEEVAYICSWDRHSDWPEDRAPIYRQEVRSIEEFLARRDRERREEAERDCGAP